MDALGCAVMYPGGIKLPVACGPGASTFAAAAKSLSQVQLLMGICSSLLCACALLWLALKAAGRAAPVHSMGRFVYAMGFGYQFNARLGSWLNSGKGTFSRMRLFGGLVKTR